MKRSKPINNHKSSSPYLTRYGLVIILCVFVLFLLAAKVLTATFSSSPSSSSIPTPPAGVPQSAEEGIIGLGGACGEFSNPSLFHNSAVWRNELDRILTHGTRVAGSFTEGHQRVLRHLARQMSCGGVWSLQYDNFTDSTPYGKRHFVNLISEWVNPRQSTGKHLVLAAHWDSKLLASGEGHKEFVGACDSAAPIVVLLNLMRLMAWATTTALDGDDNNVSPLLLQYLIKEAPQKVTVMLFDGEEAFVDWKDNDHTYGSRHLATLWKNDGRLALIDLFVLLDLIGPKGLTYHNFFAETTGKDYTSLRTAMVKWNRRVAGNQQLVSFPHEPRGFPHKVSDDHEAWLQYGVRVLHLIPVPFPKVWHTIADDATAIDSEVLKVFFFALAESVLKLPVEAMLTRN